jgi:hypothetical protein
MATPIEELSEPDPHPWPPFDDEKVDPTTRPPPAAAAAAAGKPPPADGHATLAHLTTNATTRSTAADTREAANRLGDDLAVLQAERKASNGSAPERRSEASRREIPFRRSREIDDYALEPSGSQRTSAFRGERPNTGCGRVFVRVHDSVWLVRYFMYIMPVFLILLVPVLLGLFVFDRATVGDVPLLWFSIWLEIVWLSLWAARVSIS